MTNKCLPPSDIDNIIEGLGEYRFQTSLMMSEEKDPAMIELYGRLIDSIDMTAANVRTLACPI